MPVNRTSARTVRHSWRLSSQFTLNAGLRWEPCIATSSTTGAITHFDLDRFTRGIKSTVFTNAPASLMFSRRRRLSGLVNRAQPSLAARATHRDGLGSERRGTANGPCGIRALLRPAAPSVVRRPGKQHALGKQHQRHQSTDRLGRSVYRLSWRESDSIFAVKGQAIPGVRQLHDVPARSEGHEH